VVNTVLRESQVRPVKDLRGRRVRADRTFGDRRRAVQASGSMSAAAREAGGRFPRLDGSRRRQTISRARVRLARAISSCTWPTRSAPALPLPRRAASVCSTPSYLPHALHPLGQLPHSPFEREARELPSRGADDAGSRGKGFDIAVAGRLRAERYAAVDRRAPERRDRAKPCTAPGRARGIAVQGGNEIVTGSPDGNSAP